jgi:protein-tyrosine-phosphatase
MTPKSMLIVCIGNTCRSPMAEAIAKRIWPNRKIESVGTNVWREGGSAADEAITVMSSMGYDIRGHRTTSIEMVDISSFEFVVVLDKEARRTLVAKYGIDESKIVDLFVKDPVGSSIEQYIRCAKDLNKRLAAVGFESRT